VTRTPEDVSYELGAQLTFRVLERFKMFGPEFQFPPPDIALIASIADVGKYLARNETARVVIRELMSECDRLQLGDYPTAMMLRVCLEQLDIPIKWVPFAELGIPGKLQPMGPRGRA
jgi:hypothetical protein